MLRVRVKVRALQSRKISSIRENNFDALWAGQEARYIVAIKNFQKIFSFSRTSNSGIHVEDHFLVVTEDTGLDTIFYLTMYTHSEGKVSTQLSRPSLASFQS